MAVGLILLAVYAVVRIDGLVASRSATQAFDQLAINGSLHSRDSQAAATIPDPVNTSAWAPERAAAFAASLVKVHATPLGVLRLDKLNLRIPVFEGTSGRVLNRGAGWIRGTARPASKETSGLPVIGMVSSAGSKTTVLAIPWNWPRQKAQTNM